MMASLQELEYIEIPLTTGCWASPDGGLRVYRLKASPSEMYVHLKRLAMRLSMDNQTLRRRAEATGLLVVQSIIKTKLLQYFIRYADLSRLLRAVLPNTRVHQGAVRDIDRGMAALANAWAELPKHNMANDVPALPAADSDKGWRPLEPAAAAVQPPRRVAFADAAPAPAPAAASIVIDDHFEAPPAEASALDAAFARQQTALRRLFDDGYEKLVRHATGRALSEYQRSDEFKRAREDAVQAGLPAALEAEVKRLRPAIQQELRTQLTAELREEVRRDIRADEEKAVRADFMLEIPVFDEPLTMSPRPVAAAAGALISAVVARTLAK